MAPVDRLHLPFRWQFVPVRHPRDSSIHWKWQAFSQAGQLAHESQDTFDTLTECIADARKAGYVGTGDI
jgi:hypothetical protein